MPREELLASNQETEQEAEKGGKNSINCCLCRVVFGLFALAFISVALLVIFWEDHRIFVSCCIAGVYLLLFLFFLGKARNLAANMPYAFEESRQILAADVAAFRASCNKKAGVAAQQPVDPTEGENNNAGK